MITGATIAYIASSFGGEDHPIPPGVVTALALTGEAIVILYLGSKIFGGKPRKKARAR